MTGFNSVQAPLPHAIRPADECAVISGHRDKYPENQPVLHGRLLHLSGLQALHGKLPETTPTPYYC